MFLLVRWEFFLLVTFLEPIISIVLSPKVTILPLMPFMISYLLTYTLIMEGVFTLVAS